MTDTHSPPLHPAGSFRLQIGDADLNFRIIAIPDPVPTARQILDAAGARPIEEHLVIALLPNGATETLRLDETFDLRGRGAERVVIFKTDRTFRFEVDRQEREWGSAHISGRAIKLLANVDPAKHDLYQEVKGTDPLIRDDGVVDLEGRGVERFYTIITQTTEGLAALPPADRAHLEARGISYEVLAESGQTAVILKAYDIPSGKFDHAVADILILLPAGYPDALVDMFYCDPWLRLASTNQYAKAADVPHVFGGRTWQRWSRHNDAWRPGVDGIHTVLARIDRALKEAA
jgi:hypothetical protein